MIKPIILKNGRKIGPGFPCYIIAEIGSNHDGSLEKAKQLITLAKKSGANAAKFQSFQAHTLTNVYTKHLDGWKNEPSFEILGKLTILNEWHQELKSHADAENIDFLSTPFDLERLALLNDLDIPLIKISSGDLTNKEFLIAAAKLKKPIIISTGAAYLGEVDQAILTLQANGATDIAVLQCVSCYPASYNQANIFAMKTMMVTFQLICGYSDHTPGIVVPIGAVALGASIIEKHFTDDKKLDGPDHAHSLDPESFSKMVTSIRELEQALGNGIKKPVLQEMDERVMARRGLYANRDIKLGETLTKEMVKIVRHAFPEGIPAMNASEIIGKTARKEIMEHELLTWDCFSP